MSKPRFARIFGKLVFALAVVFSAVTLAELRPEIAALGAPFQNLTASLTAEGIRLVGLPVLLADTILTHPSGFRFQVSYGCTGVVPVAIIVLTMLVMPLSQRQRLIAISVGICMTIAVNLIRLVGLYWVGIYSPEGFVIAHEWIGQALVVLTTAVFTLHWVGVAAKPNHLPMRKAFR